MKPSAYKHIAAWVRANQLHPNFLRQQQRLAAKENAPVDAVYRIEGMHLAGLIGRKDGEWVTFGQCGPSTRRTIEVQLNKGAR